ncbi:hypothetical protein SRABI83_03634 [Arthrobacter sp. Bi83]|uniref:hypothetical protein n=1 Tax=Arthrobacter sp. Bi83 TaxID=2822353 RepID=UPI001D733A1E|nr:hypothetical protein [Arthrobacter sp. Bi83]CAH0270481.1 hypothetical protein SRABI83_03634 [Arthrobacter sp. Bi83]
MPDAGSDPIDFREIDVHGNPTHFGRANPGRESPPGPGTHSPGANGPGAREWSSAEASGAGFTPRGGRFPVNPFIAVLWVLVAGLILAAFGAFNVAQESLNAPTSVESPQMGYMWMSFAPFLLFAGVLGLLGLLFWHATQWGSNREKQPPPS